MEWGRVASVLGLILCAIEIWKPRLSVFFEKEIELEILKYNDFQKLYLAKFRELGGVANATIKEVVKGPKLDQTIDESQAQMLGSVENTKENLKFYLASIINFGLMRPIKIFLVLLNKIGRGRAVGGIGLVLGVLGSVL